MHTHTAPPPSPPGGKNGVELFKRGQYRDHLRRGKALLAQLVARRRDELETRSYVDAHKRRALLCRLARAEGDGTDAEGERAAEAQSAARATPPAR